MLTQKTGTRIHWIADDDPEAVVRISRKCFGPDAWEPKDVDDFIGRSDCIPKVISVGDVVAGYNFYVLHKHIVQIKQFAVDENFRRQGFGSHMLKQLIRELPRLRRRIITVAVQETDLRAQLFFKSNGFRWFRTLKDYEAPDVYAMKYVAKKERRRP